MLTSSCRVPSPRIVRFAMVFLAMAVAPFPADAASPVHLRWDGLSTVVGKTVSIAMPGGTAITGKATGVEPDALFVDVKSTSDARAYPKGFVRVPRASLHRFEMQRKGDRYRFLGTTLGALGGLFGGALSALAIQGGIFGNEHQGAAVAAFVSITAAGTAAGYLVGNAADKHWTPVEIID